MYSIHLFKNFNNYYNRQLIKYDTLEEYLADDRLIDTFEKRNFDIQDGLSTKHIINYASANLPVPDYCVVENEDSHEFSRWFVIECRQTRGCQYEISLKRDIIAEHYEVLKESPCLIKKGYVGNDNVLVFNKEPQEYNKIKTKELLIKDSTGIGYVVGFIGKDVAGSSTTKIYSTYTEGSISEDFDYNSLSDTMKNYFAIGSATPNSYATRKKKIYVNVHNIGADIEFEYKNGTRYIDAGGYISLGKSVTTDNVSISVNSSSTPPNTHLLYEGSKVSGYPVVPTVDYAFQTVIQPLYNGIQNTMNTKLNNQNVNYDFILGNDTSFLNTLASYNNKICKINNVYYKVEFKESFYQSGVYNNNNYSFTANVRQSLPTSSDLSNIGSSCNISNLQLTTDNFTTSDITISYDTYRYYLKLTQQNVDIYTYITPEANRNHLIDAPYDMFVFPYSDDYSYTVNSTSYLASKNMAINLAQSICEASGSETYDIQIVPYCPFDIQQNDWSLFNYQPILKPAGNNNDDNDDIIIGYYFWADKSSRSINILENRSELTLSTNPSYKEITQLNKYILCSPDKTAQWEFNPAMNHGITNWIVSYEYRPFSSYLKIEPEFSWLYGNSYYNNLSDTRGLVINSSYSLTQLTDV